MILYTWPDTHGEVSLPKGGRLTKITASAFATVSNLTAPFLIRQRKFLFLLASVYSYTADVFYSILLPSALRLSSITVRLHPFHRSVVHYLLPFPNQRHGQAPHAGNIFVRLGKCNYLTNLPHNHSHFPANGITAHHTAEYLLSSVRKLVR